jgi:hypothetical protein
MAASLIERLPVGLRQKALRQLSRNNNAPGGSARQSTRAVRRDFAKRSAELGICLIEVNVTGALAAQVGCVQPPGVTTVTIDTGGGTPSTVDITTGEMEAVTWAGAGTKTLSVTAPANLKGEAQVTV